MPGGGVHPPSGRLDRTELDEVGVPHGGTGDHETVFLKHVVDCIGVFKRLHIGVSGGGGGGPGGAYTSIIPVSDQ